MIKKISKKIIQPVLKRKLIKGETFLINHPDSDPGLLGTQYIGQDSWLYEDRAQQSLMQKVAIAWGFNLPDFDTWLENLEPCEAKNELVERRINLINLDKDMLRLHVEWLKLRRLMIDRDDFVVPLAKERINQCKVNRENAKCKRPKAERPYIKEIKRIMRLSKVGEERTLDQFLASAINGSEDIKIIESGNIAAGLRYEFVVDDITYKAVSRKTVERYWTESS